MSNMSWVSLANDGTTSASSTGSALASSTTLTDISPGGNTAGQAFTIPASALQAGQLLEFTAAGAYSTTGTPTLLIGLYFGGVAGTALAVTAATTTGNNVASGVWILKASARVATTGTSGTILTLGSVLGIGATPGTAVLMPATSASGGSATVDTSTSKIVTVGAQWGTNSASNTITQYHWAAKILN